MNITLSYEKPSTAKNCHLEIFELLIPRESLFLWHPTMDSNAREILFWQQRIQSTTALHRTNENNDLQTEPSSFKSFENNLSIMRAKQLLNGVWGRPRPTNLVEF